MTRTRLPLPEPDKSETHGFEGWSFGVDGAKKTSDHTYKIHWWREAKMHAHAAAVSDAENAALMAEVERLREALHSIAWFRSPDTRASKMVEAIESMAVAALAARKAAP